MLWITRSEVKGDKLASDEVLDLKFSHIKSTIAFMYLGVSYVIASLNCHGIYVRKVLPIIANT